MINIFKITTFIAFSVFIITSCAKNNNLEPYKSNKNSQSSVYSLIKSNSLDLAGESYVKLKDSEDSASIKSAASALAVAHIAKSEYILANFYIQEALAIDASDSFLKYLLIKNQFLSANLHNRDQSYMQKALSALKSNQYLVDSSDSKILANTMLLRVKLDMAWSNKEVSNLYKRLNKPDASNLYTQKIESLGFKIEDIVKY
jgi:outer membrane protein assembly factor BamD